MEQFQPEGGKFHVAGVSNGGIRTFRFAIENPELVHSLIVLPGYPLDNDRENLANLVDITVSMFVGENDGSWVSRMQTAEQALTELGGQVTLEIMPGEGHVIRSLNGERLFDLLESFR
jgi:predicted esterase